MAVHSHGLGFGNGSLIENTDTGTVTYRASGKILPAFSCALVDVTGVTGQRKGLHVIMRVHGQGTVLAEVEVSHGTTEVVSSWFKSRIGSGATRVEVTNGAGLADELTKLAGLLRDGLLSADEFQVAKQKLLGTS